GTVDRLVITASGGPFRGRSAGDLADVTVEQALAHPTWAMGGKITIDSATMMNKGLELIEARWLFDVPYDRIDILVHPESIIHSLVEFQDGSQIAQLSLPDMRLPIQYALTYPDHLPGPCRRLSLAEVGSLHFEQPDVERFPALRLAREAGLAGSTYPTVLSAADEVVVDAFVAGRIAFPTIAEVVDRALNAHQPETELSWESIAAADQWGREIATDLLQRVM
ncbi:MAG: 1-deoxy-D-xylulose-5-phosphate reductoisomerase, partial [Thermomicrobiales bacterium]